MNKKEKQKLKKALLKEARLQELVAFSKSKFSLRTVNNFFNGDAPVSEITATQIVSSSLALINKAKKKKEKLAERRKVLC
jgi:hypothetical protein